VFKHGALHLVAFFVGERELFGKIGEDAQAVRSGVDHEVDRPTLTVKIKAPSVVENGGRHRKYASVDWL
jgi:hypothetical protein